MRHIKLPTFVVIGAPKSGTTSLYYYLKQHPEIYLPDQKELHYFSSERLLQNSLGPGDGHGLKPICKSESEYVSWYKHADQAVAVGEVSPSYLYYCEIAAKIRHALGEVKIIVMLRNPVDKAYSQYMHLVRENREKLTFYEALLQERDRAQAGWSDLWRYAESSLYSDRLGVFIDVFGSANVKVIYFERFIKHAESSLAEIFDFIGVDNSVKCDVSRRHNRTGVPRFMVMATLLARDYGVKRMMRQIVPRRVRDPLRSLVMEWNTGVKPKLDLHAKHYLESYFETDLEKLGRILDARPPW